MKRISIYFFCVVAIGCITSSILYWENEKTNEIKSPIVDFEFSRFRKLAFSGIHIINPSIFEFLSDFTEKFSIIDFYLSICNTEQVIAYVPDNLRIIDVGKPESLKKANSFFIK